MGWTELGGALQFCGLGLDAPQLGLLVSHRLDLFEVAPKVGQLGCVEFNAAGRVHGQHLARGASLLRLGIGPRTQGLLPLVHIELRVPDLGQHHLVRVVFALDHRAHLQQSAQHLGAGRRHIAHILDRQHRAHGEAELLQRGRLARTAQQLAVHAQGPCSSHGFVQRLGQLQRHALQVAAERVFDLALAQPQAGHVRRAAAQQTSHTGQAAQLGGLLQGLGTDTALQDQAGRSLGQAVVETQTTIELGVRAQYPQAHAIGHHPRLAVDECAAGLGETRQMGCPLHIVAIQFEGRLHPRQTRVAQGHEQTQLLLGHARGLHRAECAAQLVGQRGTAHQLQRVHQLAFENSVDLDQRVVHVVDLHIQLGHLHHATGTDAGRG